MPELPEVEHAVRRLRPALAGKTIRAIWLLHPAYRRRLSARTCRSLVGAVIHDVSRRGKHQFIHLADGRVLQAHFRMTGEWVAGRAEDELPRFARCVIELTDGCRVTLSDARALGTVELLATADALGADLGPEPTDPLLTAAVLAQTLRTRRTSIKGALLDQRVVAGLGNIYVVEALWHAKIDPRTIARALDDAQVRTLLAKVRLVLARATGARYDDPGARRLAVYDREGKLCRRCRRPIVRMTQSGRSTYFCEHCQRR